jgi:hypothetical protein
MIIQLGVPKSLGVPPNHPEIDHDLVMKPMVTTGGQQTTQQVLQTAH